MTPILTESDALLFGSPSDSDCSVDFLGCPQKGAPECQGPSLESLGCPSVAVEYIITKSRNGNNCQQEKTKNFSVLQLT
jgi:hypothetical protein